MLKRARQNEAMGAKLQCTCALEYFFQDTGNKCVFCTYKRPTKPSKAAEEAQRGLGKSE
jgi:hypothetical protein